MNSCGNSQTGNGQASEGDATDQGAVATHLPRRLAWAVTQNTVAQLAGRFAASGGRFLAYVLIARGMGLEVLGQYAVILSFLAFFEALMDFGMTDVFVREISEHPRHKGRLLSILSCVKVVQALVCYGLLAAALPSFRYSREIIVGGMIAGLEVAFLGGILVFRTHFKATLQMARDTLGEAVGVAAFLAALGYVCLRGGGLSGICWAFVASRGVYVVTVLLLGGKALKLRSGRRDAVRAGPLLAAALPVGVSVLLVALYVRLDIIMLSKLDSLQAAALYSAAFAFVFPLIAVPASLAQALFPILSFHWAHDRERLTATFQQGINWAAVFAGGCFCVILAAAGPLMWLMRPEAVEAAPALRLLASALFLMFLSAVVGPMFVVTHRQWLGLMICAGGVGANATMNAFLIPRFSYMGAVIATLATEVCALVASVWLIQRLIGYRVRWRGPMKVLAATALGLGAAYALGVWDSPWGAALAVALYAAAVWATRAVTWEQLRTALRR